ncbi:methionine ABC transporter permease [Bacillus salipaludis]|uniref:methionine ABC transporter permease n=1 Tax=Bacillus salipaludis TaxID=2547811 RepID=UPI002E1BC0F7|nr:ABC transporter permease [Bacillus salipaludis]
MSERLNELLPLFSVSIYETTLMVVFSLIFSIIIGIPLGVLLVITRPNHLMPNKFLFNLLSSLVNAIRSVPFIILMLAIIPFTQMIVGTSIGIRGAVVPLVVCIAPYIARLLETAILEVNDGIIEAYKAMGASTIKIITRIILREALPGIVLCMTIATIGLIDLTAMAGAVGAGGIGDLALRYGYQQWNMSVIIGTVITLIVIVQIIQTIGNFVSRKLKKN